MLLCFRTSSSDIMLRHGQSGCIIALYDCGKRLLPVAGSWPGTLRNASGATPRLPRAGRAQIVHPAMPYIRDSGIPDSTHVISTRVVGWVCFNLAEEAGQPCGGT